MPVGAHRSALIAIAALLVLSALVPSSTATPTTSSYVINVNVTIAGGAPAPPGTVVNLMSLVTHENCTSTTTPGSFGAVTFGSPNCELQPGWFTASVRPQVDTQTTTPLLLLPTSGASNSFYASQSDLTGGTFYALSGLQQTSMNQSLYVHVNATAGTPDRDSALVQLLDPSYPGFAIAENIVSTDLNFTQVPAGSWTVYVQGFTQLNPNYFEYNYSGAYIPDTASGVHSSYVTLDSAGLLGTIVPNDHGWFFNQTNVTVYDPATGALYSHINDGADFFTSPTNHIQVGAYNTPVTVLVSPQGYSTAWTYLNPTTTNPLVSEQFDVNDLVDAPATTIASTLTFTTGSFNKVNVSGTETLDRNASVWQLPDSQIGDLYAQVAQDFQGGQGLNATPWAWSGFENFLHDQGGLYSPDQENLEINGTYYKDNGTVSSSWGATPADLNFTSRDTYSYATAQNYTLSTAIGNDYETYNFTMGFRYPSAGESLTYTVNLPKNYVLAANTPAPLGTRLTPAGPGGTWTSFTVTPFSTEGTTDVPVGPQNNTAYFTVEHVQNLTAVAAVSSSNFAFSNRTNIISPTHDHYEAIVGSNQNASLTSQSVYPSGFNVTSLHWDLGTSGATAKTQCYGATISATNWLNVSGSCPTVWVTFPTGGNYSLSLTAIANGGNTSTQDFNVLVDSQAPSPFISLNDTHAYYQNLSTPYTKYLWLNWSQELRLNATNSTSITYPGGPAGTLSDSVWNISSGPTYYTVNYSIGAQAASVFGNVTYSFLGAGYYHTKANPVNVDGGSFALNGWVYYVNLSLFDAGGKHQNATLIVLVNDTEKPDAIGGVEGGPYFSPANEEGLNTTSGVETGNGTCTIQLVDKWSYDPHNGTVATYTWNISNQASTGFKTKWWNETADTTLLAYVSPPQSSATSVPYNLTLNVTDLAGNYDTQIFQFTCAINTTENPILQATELEIDGSTSPTLTSGSSYTLSVNISNQGGIDSTGNSTSLRIYTQTSSGGSVSTVSTGVSWFGWVGGVKNGTTAQTGQVVGHTIDIHYNNTYEADYTFSTSKQGTYEVCVNGTAANEFAGSYKTGANVECITITVNQSPLVNLAIYGGVIAAIAVGLIVLYFLMNRRRTGGAKKGASSKSRKDEDDEDEDDEPAPKSKGKSSSDKDEDDDE